MSLLAHRGSRPGRRVGDDGVLRSLASGGGLFFLPRAGRLCRMPSSPTRFPGRLPRFARKLTTRLPPTSTGRKKLMGTGEYTVGHRFQLLPVDSWHYFWETPGLLLSLLFSMNCFFLDRHRNSANLITAIRYQVRINITAAPTRALPLRRRLRG